MVSTRNFKFGQSIKTKKSDLVLIQIPDKNIYLGWDEKYTLVTSETQKSWIFQGWRTEDPLYKCPLCKEKVTEDELWIHWSAVHYSSSLTLVCPICVKQSNNTKAQGNLTWGYSSHLHHKHGPVLNLKNYLNLTKVESDAPTYGFALVVCRHPDKQHYLLVEEGCEQGWWLPGGRVDPGETFKEAAIRETLEEGGILVELKGILRVEYSPYKDGGARMRIIFYAEPKDDRPPKQTPNFESVRAAWITWDEMSTRLREKRMHLRGNEPIEWFNYLENGGKIHDIKLLTLEQDPVEIVI